jgi:hypothetical protein
VADADRVCRADPSGQVRGPALQVVAVDARGGEKLTLLYRSPTDMAECYLDIGPDGRFTASGSGSGGMDGNIAPNELAMRSASQTGPDGNDPGETAISGVAGPAIAAVRVHRPNGQVIEASVGGGLFTAWWPMFDDRFMFEGIDAAGVPVTQVGEGM